MLEDITLFVGGLVSMLPTEAIALGLGVLLVATYVVGYRLRYKNDPYFPPYFSPRFEKVIVILTERTSTGLSLVDIVEGKWGTQGMYVQALDKLYYDIQFMGGRKKLIHLTKGVDNEFKPAGLAIVQTGINYIEEEVDVENDEGEVTKVKSVREEKTAEVIEGDFKSEEEKRTFLTLIIPSLEEYRLTMSSFVESIYQLAETKLLKNLNPGQKGFLAKFFQDLDRDKLIMLVLIVAIIVLYLLATDSVAAMIKACPAITHQMAQVNQTLIS